MRRSCARRWQWHIDVLNCFSNRLSKGFFGKKKPLLNFIFLKKKESFYVITPLNYLVKACCS